MCLNVHTKIPGFRCCLPLTPVSLLFVAVTLREDSAKRLERRARRVSKCLSDYSLASDSGVFEPPAKRLEADLMMSFSPSSLPQVLRGSAEGTHTDMSRCWNLLYTQG